MAAFAVIWGFGFLSLTLFGGKHKTKEEEQKN
jgi:hypothetical protein